MPRSFHLSAVLLLWFGVTPLVGWSHKAEESLTPAERIPVAPLGYRPPGPLYMLSGKAFSSLDFIDANHLLFTFHQPRLLRREQSNRSDNDQIIQALVLELPGGAIQAAAEWRMHDRSRYLWPLAEGKFLVRQRNDYARTDASLKLEAYINVATPVVATEVSPDGSVLVIEHQYERHTVEEHSRLAAQADKFGDADPAEDTQVTVMKASSREVLAAIRTELPTNIPVTSDGYVAATRDKTEDQFLIRFVPFEGQSLTLGKVSSTCTPHESFLSQEALVIESCGPKTTDTFLDAWTTKGKKLWSGHRDGHLVLPTFAHSVAGDRFAVAVLRSSHTIDLADSLNDEDVREQVVQVFDTATGALLMSTTASPILLAGQNFALSGDGRRLAVLRQGAIEIYKVPELPAADKK